MTTNCQIACVTGGSGTIGKRIVKKLRRAGYKIRVLSRSRQPQQAGIQFVQGDLNDALVLNGFLSGADFLFHCAAELYDASRMNTINVKGTQILIAAAQAARIGYFCHISSAGVVGKTGKKWVDENAACLPQNDYERSKYDAEQIVLRGIEGCRVVILRPTNVVDTDRPGALNIVIDCTPMNRLKLFFTGGECAHIIHAETVAAAALHFVDHSFTTPECFFVSADHEPMNTFSELSALYNRMAHGIHEKPEPMHLPILIPWILRWILRGTGNRGDVRYSSGKLFKTGFKLPLNIEATISQFLNSTENRPCAY